MKWSILIVAAVCVIAIMFTSSNAVAQCGCGVGSQQYYAAPPARYYQPQPRYYAPPVRYHQSQPRYYAPPVRYHQPQPRYYRSAPPVRYYRGSYGYYGGGVHVGGLSVHW